MSVGVRRHRVERAPDRPVVIGTAAIGPRQPTMVATIGSAIDCELRTSPVATFAIESTSSSGSTAPA